MALTEMEVKKAKAADKPQKLTGGGMYLYVHPNGGKYWCIDYRFDGKQKTLALGVYPEITLADSRDRRDEARKLLKNGADPGAIKQAAKQAEKKIEQIIENSFSLLAIEYHTLKKPDPPLLAGEYLGAGMADAV